MCLLQVKPFFIILVTLCVLWHVEVDASFVTAIGCYRDRLDNRAMPELLASYRNNGLDWRNLDKTVIQKCKKEAAKKGYKCIGIQFYGECWSGRDACDTYSRYGNSDECFCSGKFSANTLKKYDPEGLCLGAIGGRWTNFVYEIE